MVREDSTANIGQESGSVSSRSSVSTDPFVFYDPYYEELVRRKQLYEKNPPTKSTIQINHSKQIPLDLGNISHGAEPRLPPATEVRRIPQSDSSTDAVKILEEKVFRLERELEDSRLQIKANERVITSLYNDIDRAKASLDESLERERKLSKDLVHLKRGETQSATVSVSDFKELESKYLNSIRVIDDLNWKLHKFPDSTS